MTSDIFDLMDEMAARQRQREFEQRAHAMPDWEKHFLLGFLQYTDAHPEVLERLMPLCPACGGDHAVQRCGAVKALLMREGT